MGLTLIWPTIQVHLPKISDWQLGSTSDSAANIAVFGEGPSINGGFITIPIKRVVNGSAVETAVLKGPAVSNGASAGLQMPAANASGGTGSTLGLGTSFALGPMAPRPMGATNFEGVVIVGTPAGQVLQPNATSMIMFVPDAYLQLGPLASTTIKAVALTFGVQSATAIAQAGTNVLAYRVRVSSDPDEGQMS